MRESLGRLQSGRALSDHGDYLDMGSDVAVCTTLGKTELSAVILAEAVRMAYSLGLHRPKSVLGGDFLQTQMQRRMFWILYQTDK
jgi:hypothetical protein